MSRCSIQRTLVVASLLLAATISCQRGPARVQQPSISPSDAGKLAMEQYDTNGDGKVAGDELDKAPSLKAALPRLDTDGDGGVSADEVAARVNAWKAMKTGMVGVPCHVTLDGQALAGALITFEPEKFLGDEIKTSSGTTDQFGAASPRVPQEFLPDPKLPSGAHFGLYKVRVSKIVNGKETIPARYNTETILGLEVSYDEPGMRANHVPLVLKSAN